MGTLVVEIKPADAAAIATIQVDGEAMVGKRLELRPGTKRVHVSVIAMGYRRFSKDIDIGTDNEVVDLEIEMGKRDSKKKRTLAVTLGMGALGVIGWLVRRR